MEADLVLDVLAAHFVQTRQLQGVATAKRFEEIRVILGKICQQRTHKAPHFSVAVQLTT